jgi:uncharacterized protein (DUF58 family)
VWVIVKANLDSDKQLFELFSKSKMESLFPGDWDSIVKGSGYDFFDLRTYVPGDPLNKMHWKQTAKTGELFVIDKLTESYASVMLLYDLSKSVAFGKKEDMQAVITASLAYSALQKNNSCGMIMFSDVVDSYIPPKCGDQLRIVINALQETKPKECNDTNMAKALQTLVDRVPRSLSFIISDFNVQRDYKNILGRINKMHHDIVCLIVVDTSELDVPTGGCILELTDMEKGGSFVFDAQKYAKLYKKEMMKAKEQIKNMLNAYRCDAEIITSTDSFIKKIRNLMIMRKRKQKT